MAQASQAALTVTIRANHNSTYTLEASGSVDYSDSSFVDNNHPDFGFTRDGSVTGFDLQLQLILEITGFAVRDLEFDFVSEIIQSPSGTISTNIVSAISLSSISPSEFVTIPTSFSFQASEVSFHSTTFVNDNTYDLNMYSANYSFTANGDITSHIGTFWNYDSNGATAGGELVSVNIIQGTTAIPEPSIPIFAAFSGVLFAVRRKK